MDKRQIKKPKDTSKKETKKIIKKRRPDFEFLRRTTIFNQGDDLQLKKIIMKRLYLRKLKEVDDNPAPKLAVQRKLIRNKLLKTIKHFNISTCNKLYWSEAMKNCQNLQTFTIDSECNSIDIGKAVRHLKVLPKGTKKVSLNIQNEEETPANGKDVCRIPKVVGRLRNLISFHKALWYNGEPNYVEKEMKLINKCMKRLPHVKNVSYVQSFSEQRGFQKLMKKEGEYPAITALTIELTADRFPDYRNFYGEFFHQEYSIDLDESSSNSELTSDISREYINILEDLNRSGPTSEEEKTSSDELGGNLRGITSSEGTETQENNRQRKSSTIVTSDEEMNTEEHSDSETDISDDFFLGGNIFLRAIAQKVMTAEVAAFFKFKRFPNLKKLTFNNQDPLYPLGGFVIDGFASLKKLEELSMEVAYRSMGTSFLFLGFLKLPLLKSFSLRIPFITREEWIFLRKFIKKQVNLESLTLIISSERGLARNYHEQNREITRTIHALEGAKKLKDLYLSSSFWSIEALSEGLKNLTMKNQLTSLKIEAFDDTMTSKKPVLERVEGLCQFIKQQKDSLHVLFVRLPHVLKQTLINHLGEAIGELTELRELVISMNLAFVYGMDFYTMYFEETLKAEAPWVVDDKMNPPKHWNINLAKHLGKLGKLEKFSIHFDVISEENANCLKWFIDILRVLSTMHQMKRVDFFTTSTYALSLIVPKMKQAIFDLTNVKQVDALIFNDRTPYRRDIGEIYDAIHEMHDKQCLRTELMF